MPTQLFCIKDVYVYKGIYVYFPTFNVPNVKYDLLKEIQLSIL